MYGEDRLNDFNEVYCHSMSNIAIHPLVPSKMNTEIIIEGQVAAVDKDYLMALWCVTDDSVLFKKLCFFEWIAAA